MGQQTTQQNQTATPQLPSYLTPYYQNAANQATSAQGSLPSLSQLYGQVPLLQTAPLSSQETGIINQFPANIGPNVPVTTAEGGLGSFIGTGGQPSTATNAALQAFKDITAPEIMQQSALMGQGNSGAAQQALALAQEQALVPFMQQDLSNQLSASGQLGQLGLGQQSMTQQQLMNALQATDLPRQIQQQANQAAYDQATGQFNFASGLQTSPLSNFPNLIGQLQNATSTLQQPKF